MSVRIIAPKNPVLSATVASSTPVKSSAFYLGGMFAPQVSYLVDVGIGLTATFNIMVSNDGITYYDSGTPLPSVAGAAKTFIAQYSGAFPWVLFQVVQSGGSGLVTVSGTAKGGA